MEIYTISINLQEIHSALHMSLLLLPDEILNQIICCASEGADPNSLARSRHTFSPNSVRIRQGYDDLASLSMTCVRLRNMCGPVLFPFLSLVRKSEIDAILAYPTRLDKWSDCRVYRRAYFKELLESNFRECSDAELAKKSFRTSVSGDVRFWSRYQRSFSANNHVTELEICNETLRSGELGHFPLLRNLRVLDSALLVPIDEHSLLLIQIALLLINFGTFLRSDAILLWVSHLERLDTVCEVNDLHPGHSFSNLKSKLSGPIRLRQFNFFVNDADVLRYAEFVDFLRFLVQKGSIESISIRLTRKNGHANINKWNILENNGPAILEALRSPALRSVTLDYDVISKLEFPADYQPVSAEKAELCFTLVDYSLSVPKLLFKPREIVANTIQALGATEVVFIYGEVIDQAHLHAIGVMSNLLVYLALDSKRNYSKITKVSMEKAWSVADDTLVRTHYEKLMDSWETAPKGAQRQSFHRDIVRVALDENHLFTSPRYRRRDNYIVIPQDSTAQGALVPIMLPTFAQNIPRDAFWSVESSLRDLEHYGVREKALSRLWA